MQPQVIREKKEQKKLTYRRKKAEGEKEKITT